MISLAQLPIKIQRQTLALDWNAIVRAGCRITIRQFAAKHGLKCETWRREYLRGAIGVAVPDPKDRRRRKYAEYDPFKAQDEVNENNANKGTRMRVTNQMAFLFRRHVIDEKLSPYDALCHMKEEMPGQDIPCLSTWHKHINASNTITQAQAVNNLIAAIGSAGQSFIQNLTQMQQADATEQGALSKKSEEELDQTKDLFNQALTLVDSIVKLMQAVRAAEAQSMRDAIQA